MELFDSLGYNLKHVFEITRVIAANLYFFSRKCNGYPFEKWKFS